MIRKFLPECELSCARPNYGPFLSQQRMNGAGQSPDMTERVNSKAYLCARDRFALKYHQQNRIIDSLKKGRWTSKGGNDCLAARLQTERSYFPCRIYVCVRPQGGSLRLPREGFKLLHCYQWQPMRRPSYIVTPSCTGWMPCK